MIKACLHSFLRRHAYTASSAGTLTQLPPQAQLLRLLTAVLCMCVYALAHAGFACEALTRALK